MNARGALAPLENGRTSMLASRLTEANGFVNRGGRTRGWRAEVQGGRKGLTVPFDYTWCPDDLFKHPRSKILSEITAQNLPFASRDDMLFVKARSLSLRTAAAGKQKDAVDFARLTREIKAPLRLDGFSEDQIKAMKKVILLSLKNISIWGNISITESRDSLEI